MQNLLEFLESVGIQFALLIAGFAGGLVSINKDKGLTPFQKFWVIVSGGFIATYLTPLIFLMLKVDNEKAKYGIAFLIGYMGLKAIELLVVRLTKKINNDGEG